MTRNDFVGPVETKEEFVEQDKVARETFAVENDEDATAEFLDMKLEKGE